jgi:urease accessory protein
MSISLAFKNDVFSLDKLQLPSRYFYFNEEENYIKLLTIGEGIFPNDKIKTLCNMQNSSCIFSTESAIKIYPSNNNYSINKIILNLINSNCEFINDELILYKNAKFLQFLKIKLDDNSTLFYCDILSSGRSYENFDFTSMNIRNKFYINSKLEYYENYDISGDEFKEYLKRHNSSNNIYAKIYIKIENYEKLFNIFKNNNITTFTHTQSKLMIIGVISGYNMFKLKQKIQNIWDIYREILNKKSFNLGKH